ncbi:hypothetical protein Rhe02_50310 [Rhizocola hellebori]|uniref:Lipoprotein n=1 Tax=Rhizocola hellebori TaxID=1392758 RepID=A0A8J3QBN3_9ACTN|nr:hypothetical protein [Rhizocola hellebori]GIH06964.1 hypothetical protein Rhe02_50310 [Rhizocola hellebori]
MKLIALGMAAVLVVSGCDTPPEKGVATAQTPTAVAGGAPEPVPTKETDYDKALRFTRCMTDNGVPTNDPVLGEMLPTGLSWGPGVTAAAIEAQRAAWGKCKALLPQTWPVKLDQREIERSRNYVLCMRENGIPEPIADANGVVDQPTDDQLYRMPGYDQAVAKCRHLVDDPANDHQD